MGINQIHYYRLKTSRKELRTRRLFLPYGLILVACALITCVATAWGQTGTASLTVQADPKIIDPGDPCLFKVSSKIPLKSLTGKWMGKTVFFNQYQDQNIWFGLGGVSLKTELGSKQTLSLVGVTVSGTQISENKGILISGGMRSRAIPDIPKGFDKNSLEDMSRLEEDKAIKREVLSTITPSLGWNRNFTAPVDVVREGSAFGIQRKYSSGAIKVHEGLDFPASAGTPIKAINSGKVLLTRKMVFEGNLVVIDHGQGLLSLYFHLSAFRVKQGELVKKGQVIGLCGATGRVTGPHLHLAVRWQGTYISPNKLFKLDLANFTISDLGSKTTPPPALEKPVVSFSASASAISQGECVDVSWNVEKAKTTKLNDKFVPATGSQHVCPSSDLTYTLIVNERTSTEIKQEVVIKVTPVHTVYELLGNAPKAKWRTSSPATGKKKLDYGGQKDTARGIVSQRENVPLENNATLPSLLEITPQQIPGGQLEGEFKLNFKIQKGDKFSTQVGLAKNEKGNTFTLRLMFREKVLQEITKGHTGKLQSWNVDLSEFADKDGKMILQVVRLGMPAAATGIYFLNPRIVR